MLDVKELTAREINKAIQAKNKPPEPIEQAELLGVKGWLFKSSSYEFASWREYIGDDKPEKARLERAKLVQISFRDKSGNVVFSEMEVPILAGLPTAEIDPIADAAMRINGFGKEGVEAIVKNLIKLQTAAGLYALLGSMGYPCPNCTKDTAPTNSKSNGSPGNTGR